MKRYLNEFIGTFFLMMIFVLTLAGGSPYYMVSLAVGAVLAALILASGRQAEAHFNPAMSLGFFLRGRLDGRSLAGFWLAQLAGSMFAALIGRFLLLGTGRAEAIQIAKIESICALPAEFLGGFLLVWVFMKSENGHRGPATGLAAMAANAAFGPISMGVFNPAIGFGLCLAGLLAWPDAWIYLVSPLVGGAAAATVFQILDGPETGFDGQN